MTTNMLQERLEDLSVFYFLVDKFKADPLVTILDAFPIAKFKYPAIAIEWSDASASSFELGSKIKQASRMYIADIFALTSTQRDELSYKIFNYLDDTIPVYDYNEGFPPSVTPSLISGLEVTEKKLKVIKIYPELVEQMYYRATLTFVAERNTR
jgi:hypothetical protein